MAKMKKRKSKKRPWDIPASRWKPFPELLDEEPGMYSIVNSERLPGALSTGMTDKVKRVLWVPFDEDGAPVSKHEMMHVWLSPRTMAGKKLQVPLPFVWAVEDARINMCAAHVGCPIEFTDRLTGQIVAQDLAVLERGDVAGFTLRAVASFGTSCEPQTLALVADDERPHNEVIRTLVAGARARLEKARVREDDIVSTFDDTLKVARWLAKELGKHGFKLPKGGRKAALIGCCAHAEDHKALRELLADSDGVEVGELRDGIRPGVMKIARPVLPHRCATLDGSRGRRRRVAAEGVELYRMDRYLTDQKVFGRRIRKRGPSGGSVLIDASGSMSLSAADIDRIIASAPLATTVAVYSGSDDEGELRVVVRDGYRASPADLDPYGSGNIVDLPALEWLSDQPAPRVWISDGGVTGCGDISTKAIQARCEEIRDEGEIVRVDSAEQAASVLAKAA